VDNGAALFKVHAAAAIATCMTRKLFWKKPFPGLRRLR
jgi:hypothetical protein